MNDKSLVGESLIGLPNGRPRGLNSFALWRYLLILAVVIIGTIYALPNFYQPDPALQIRMEASDASVSAELGPRIAAMLKTADIPIKGAEIAGSNYQVRLVNIQDQLKAKAVLSEGLLSENLDDRYVIALNRAPTTPQWLVNLGAKPMSYGLDLSGGVHFLLQVDMEKAVSDRMESEEANFRTIFREHEPRLRYVGRDWVDGTRLRIGFRDAADRDMARTALQAQYGEFTIVARDVDDNPGLLVTLSDQKIREIEDDAISQNRQSIKKRVNELGVSEPQVQRLGRSRIVVDLPGVQDSAAAKRILNKFANLEFRMVAAADARASQTETYPYEGRDVVIARRNIVTGDRVINAQQSYDQDSGLPQVSITLDSVGGSMMNAVTGKNIGNKMAILFKELIPRESVRVKENGEKEKFFFTDEIKRLINVATVQSALGFRFRITGLGLGEARD
ncbi:MAG: protein translocase subunit SecD, partial [Pseudomonadales bacterium]|nr:protein translocase subunit SecD [Pseudomonadales bacterium]